MILARLSRAIREQNWFAVVLEFIIVIAGVVIGFQISAWNAERQADEARQATLDRLHDEAEQAVAYHADFVALHQRFNARRTEAIERLIANDWADADREAMTEGITSIGILPASNPPRTVYDELVSTGQFAEIGSPELRNAISNYYSRLTFLQGQIDYMRTVSFDPVDWQRDDVTVTYEPGTARERRYELDFESLANDPDFIEGMLVGNNTQRALTNWTESTLNSAQAMCDAIAEITGRPCTPGDEAE